jgi:peptide/nickel transport system substrate-binding protein
MPRPLRPLLALLAVLAVACQPARPAPDSPRTAPGASSAAPTRVVIGGTTSVESQNPYVGGLYNLWCEVVGCLLTYDITRGEFVGRLAESWQVEDALTWVFHLRRDARWEDGSAFTAADVLHSIDRARHDPASRQLQYVAPIERAEVVDEHTVRVVTRAPTASLLDFLKHLSITNKAQFDQLGENVWRERPLGTGPYVFHELVPDRHLRLAKNPNWWGGPVLGPDEVIVRVLREPEVRITALLNNEIQIALDVPPHMIERVSRGANTQITTTPAAEMVMLVMNVQFKPWDNPLLRQAVVHAIDRDAIIQGVLQGQARRLDGPLGPGQYGYTADLQPRYAYNPERARQLVAQAGFPSGVDVDLYSPVGRYVQDKQAVEAMVPMLNAVGIRARMLTPEWPTLFAEINAGKIPFYYVSRTSFLDPGVPLAQYFETGVSKRTGYSNPRVDALFAQERAAFEPAERKRMLAELMSLVTEDAPAHFLWQQTLIRGVAKHVEFPARPDEHIIPSEIRVK